MDPNWFWRYFPLWINETMTPEVAQVAWFTYMANLFLPSAGIWFPMLVMKDAPDLNGDIALAYTVPCVTSAVCGGSSIAVGLALTALTVVGGLPCLVVGAIMGPVMYFRMAPVAALNAWDRAYKQRAIDAAGGSNDGSRPKAKASKKKAAPPSKPAAKASGADKNNDEEEAYGY